MTCDHCTRTAEGKQSCCPFHYKQFSSTAIDRRLHINGRLNTTEALDRLEYWTSNHGEPKNYETAAIRTLIDLIRKHHAEGTIV